MRPRSPAALICGLLLAGSVFPADAGGPVFSPGGPEAERLGLSASGFPVANQQTFWQLPFLVDSHSRLDEIFPARRVAKPEAPRVIARAVEFNRTRSKRANRAVSISTVQTIGTAGLKG